MTKKKLPANKQELIGELVRNAQRTIITEDKLEMLALAYLVNEIVPDDRTTQDVLRKVGELK